MVLIRCVPRTAIDISGRKFGRLTVLERVAHERKPGLIETKWRCLCECGAIKDLYSGHIRSGKTQACGCLRLERSSIAAKKLMTTHGLSKTKEHDAWHAMRQRCNNPNNKSYHRYGGRGIKVCKRWEKFENFFADMGKAPSGGTLGRIDNNGNYEKRNCRWETTMQQGRNKETCVYIEYNGRRQTQTEWAREAKIPPSSFRYFLKKGKTMNELIPC